MAFEDQIVSSINTTLETSLAGDACLSSNKFWRIAEVVSTTGTSDARFSSGDSGGFAPAIINLNGEADYIIYDDLYNIVGYHKILSSTLQLGPAYGAKKVDFLKGITDIELVVSANRTRTKKNPRQLANIILSYMPGGQITLYNTDGVTEVGHGSVYPVNQTFDSLSLFSRDYRGTENFISPSIFLFGIRYRIESNFRKECFNTCLC
jgi:hypothetical protein